MTTLDQMWEKFEAHQPFADELGYGPGWRRMCDERTEDACDAAVEAAWVTADAMDRAVAERLAERAIECIERAEGRS